MLSCRRRLLLPREPNDITGRGAWLRGLGAGLDTHGYVSDRKYRGWEESHSR